MLLLKTLHEFDAAHQLPPPYEGKCARMHGHTYHLAIEWVVKRTLDDVGMSVDFHLIKEMMDKYMSAYDHSVLNTTMTPTPTAEVMVLQITKELHDAVLQYDLLILPHRIELWETEKCAAVWQREVND